MWFSFRHFASASVPLVGPLEDSGHFSRADFELELGFAFLLREIVKAARDMLLEDYRHRQNRESQLLH